MGKALLSLLGSFTILTIELMKPFKRRTITLKWPGHVKIHYIDPPAVWWIKCLIIFWREVGTKNKEKSQLSELTSSAWEFIWLWKSLRTSPNTVSAKNICLVSDNSMVLGVRIGLLNTNWHYNPHNDAKQQVYKASLLRNVKGYKTMSTPPGLPRTASTHYPQVPAKDSTNWLIFAKCIPKCLCFSVIIHRTFFNFIFYLLGVTLWRQNWFLYIGHLVSCDFTKFNDSFFLVEV